MITRSTCTTRRRFLGMTGNWIAAASLLVGGLRVPGRG